MKFITRRSVIKDITKLTGGVTIFSSLILNRSNIENKEPIFALMGDHYHNADIVRTMLTRDVINDMGIPIKMTDDYTCLDANTLKGYQVLIVHRDGRIFPNGGPTCGGHDAIVDFCGEKIPIISDPPLEPENVEMEFWMKSYQGKAVRDFVYEGGSALFFHNVTDVGSSNEDFRHVLGATYAGHPPIRPFKVRVRRSDHPIMKGINDFIVTDEQHFMKYEKNPDYILMESVNEDGLTNIFDEKDMGTTAPAVWAYEYGRGRVCYMSPGHLLTAHWNPMYRKLKQNAVRWLLRQT